MGDGTGTDTLRGSQTSECVRNLPLEGMCQTKIFEYVKWTNSEGIAECSGRYSCYLIVHLRTKVTAVGRTQHRDGYKYACESIPGVQFRVKSRCAIFFSIAFTSIIFTLLLSPSLVVTPIRGHQLDSTPSSLRYIYCTCLAPFFSFLFIIAIYRTIQQQFNNGCAVTKAHSLRVAYRKKPAGISRYI